MRTDHLKRWRFVYVPCVAGLLWAAAPASGWLGSFGPADGYVNPVFSGNYNWADVTYYNAGAFGPNAGGGPGPLFIPPDSGRWRLVSNAGGFFSNSAMRNAMVGGAPPYPTSNPVGVPAYIVGNHFPGRNNDGHCLAVRNDTPLGTGPIVYDYSLDTFDTGGFNPAAQTTGTVSFRIYFMSDPDAPWIPGTPRQDKFTMSFVDQFGNVGAQWGYSRDNLIAWRDSASNPWNYTTWNATPNNWNGIEVFLDLTNDTFSMNFFEEATSTWHTMVPAGTPMGAAMTNFTTVRWQLEDGVHLGIGGKNFFDDAHFGGFIPTPGTVGALAGGLALLGRRRR